MTMRRQAFRLAEGGQEAAVPSKRETEGFSKAVAKVAASRARRPAGARSSRSGQGRGSPRGTCVGSRQSLRSPSRGLTSREGWRSRRRRISRRAGCLSRGRRRSRRTASARRQDSCSSFPRPCRRFRTLSRHRPRSIRRRVAPALRTRGASRDRHPHLLRGAVVRLDARARPLAPSRKWLRPSSWTRSMLIAASGTRRASLRPSSRRSSGPFPELIATSVIGSAWVAGSTLRAPKRGPEHCG